MPFFSVIIPVYNVQKYLPECLDSVLSQEFRDLEAILVDDGSTDQSGALCDSYAEKDARVRVIHQRNQGLGQARNAGLCVAQGEWILFLDSDDTWKPGSLQLVYDQMRKYPDQNLFVTKWVRFYESSGVEDPEAIGDYVSGVKLFSTLQEKVLFFGGRCGWAIWKLVIRRTLIFDPPLLFLPKVRNGEDLYWMTLLWARLDSAYFLDEILYVYRVRDAGTLSERSAENALKWLDSMALTVCALDQKIHDEQPFVHAWLMNKYALFFVLAAQKRQKEQWRKRLPDFIENLRTADVQYLHSTARILKKADEAFPGNLWIISRILCSLQRIKEAGRKKRNAVQ